MHFPSRPLAIAAATLLAASGVTALAASPAAAAACGGQGCAGFDPGQQGCTATSSTSNRYTSGTMSATIVNEYSKSCNANWVQAYESSSALSAGWRLAIEVITGNSIGGTDYVCAPGVSSINRSGNDVIETCSGTYGGATGWPMWTDMVDGTNKAYGTMYVYDRSGNLLATVEADQ